MNALFWSRFHGGVTHFPIALVFVATLFDALALFRRQPFTSAGRWLIGLAALGSLGAVASGLVLSKGTIGGNGLLLRHHIFVWPSFVLIAVLALWRLRAGEKFTLRRSTIYVCGLAVTCALISIAGFFGGEMLLGQTSAQVVSDPVLAAQGHHLFLTNCAHCHGDDARGDEGPDLHDLHKSDARIHDVVSLGIKGEMPSFAKKLNDADIRALTAYLHTLRG